MKTSDFYFDLPDELIAQTPIEPRDHSQMLCLSKESGNIEHKRFHDIIDYLEPGDTLVVNDSRVLPARLYGEKVGTGSDIEFLLLEQKEQDVWEIICRPGKKVKPGAKIEFSNMLTAEVLEVLEEGNRLVKFIYDGNFYNILDEIGQMPLPPYITEKLKDKERYQTVYSNELGSAAAPTAGLHFTKELLEKIEKKGINIASVTLHVGLGTFRPIKVNDFTNHHMHSEHYEVPQKTAEIIKRTKKAGKRVIAVGTTSCRTLESVSSSHGEIVADEGYTDIFIYPGYKFKIIDALITNFHLPESTLIMLVSAFAGYENTMQAYKLAVQKKYRFFSFGDSMFIQ